MKILKKSFFVVFLLALSSMPFRSFGQTLEEYKNTPYAEAFTAKCANGSIYVCNEGQTPKECIKNDDCIRSFYDLSVVDKELKADALLNKKRTTSQANSSKAGGNTTAKKVNQNKKDDADSKKSSEQKASDCEAKGGTYKAGSCWCNGLIMGKNQTSCEKKEKSKKDDKKDTNKSADCEAKGGSYKAGSCWCNGLIMGKNQTSCEKKEKSKKNDEEKDDQKTDKSKACTDKGGTYKAGSCWCNGLIMGKNKESCTPKNGDEDDAEGTGSSKKTKEEKAADCEAKGGTYKAGSCWCNGLIMGKNKESCTPKDGDEDDAEGTGSSKKTKEEKAADCEAKGGKYSAGSCWCNGLIMGKNKTSCESKEKEDTRTAEEKKQALEDKTNAYNEAKETEQSKENRMLTAATTAATGIGGMELAMGLSEQNADKEADQNMDAYIETMRCSYGHGKQVKASAEEVELPGGNDENLMKLRTEYLALAASLKERKTALDMKPGIEAETIIDKATSGLYDDENIGITSGAYASSYRAKMLGSEADQAKINEERKSSKNRVIAGATLVGVGAVGGMLGDSLINGKLGELIKQKKAEKEENKALKAALKIEEDALKELQSCLKKAGIKNASSLSFDSFPASILSTDDINCKEDLAKVAGDKDAKDVEAQSLFADSVDPETILNKLLESFGAEITGKMIGVSISDFDPVDNSTHRAKAIEKIQSSLNEVTERLEEAQAEEEEEEQENQNKDLAGGAVDLIKSKLVGG